VCVQFALPAVELDPTETGVWEQVRQSAVDSEAAFEALARARYVTLITLPERGHSHGSIQRSVESGFKADDL
jgi:hypothetical protein